MQVCKHLRSSAFASGLLFLDLERNFSTGPPKFSATSKRCQSLYFKFQGVQVFKGARNLVKPQLAMGSLFGSFISYFVEQETYEAMLQFVKVEVQDPNGAVYKSCPLQLTQLYLSPLSKSCQHLNQEYAFQIAVEGAKILEDRLENLTDKEVRELDKLVINRTIATLKGFLNFFDPEKTAQKAENFELKIAERCLKSAFFEKRVKGLNELKEMYWRVRNSANKDFMNKVQWLTLERFGEWLEGGQHSGVHLPGEPA